MYDVYFYEAFEEEAQLLKQLMPSHIRAGYTWKTVQEQQDDSPPSKVISIRTQSRLPIEWGSELSAILTRSTGYDHLKTYQRETGKERLSAGYLPLYCNRAVAEQAMIHWMMLLRKLPHQIDQFKSFDRDGLTGLECKNKTLAVIGVGNIGSEIVKIGQGLEMNVLGVDIVHKHDYVNYVSPEKALSEADIIVCAMNLTSDNMSYFDAEKLKKTKRGVVFVNIARGEMSPSSVLLKFIESGHLGGVALDVFDQESDLAITLRSKKQLDNQEVKATLELSKKPNVIMTPHNAFNTVESVQRKAEQSVRQITYFLEKGEFLWPIND